MKVKFKTKQITNELVAKFENPLLLKQDFHLDIDACYIVFGLYIRKNGAITIDCLNKYDHLRDYPLDLFEVVDNTVSKYWLMKTREDGGVSFMPKEYYDNEYFHDDLSEDDPEMIRQFVDLVKRFKIEQAENDADYLNAILTERNL
jgi:hypothetical protein